MKDHQFEVELLMWAVLFGLIGYEIKLAISSSREQAQILKSLLSDQKASLQVIERMRDAMQDQLTILAEDQKRRLAELARVPHLRLSLRDAPLTRELTRPIPHVQLTSRNAYWQLLVTNTGNATLRWGSLFVSVDKSQVQLWSSVIPEKVIQSTGAPGQTLQVDFGPLRENTSEPIDLSAAYPPGIGEFTLRFYAYADNFPRQSLGVMRVVPPKEP